MWIGETLIQRCFAWYQKQCHETHNYY